MKANIAQAPKTLLSIVELGGYPNFSSLFQQAGFDVTVVTSVRKALSFLKKTHPDVIVAEYNYQHTFRDRSSNLETLIAVLNRMDAIRLVVFYEQEHLDQLEKLRVSFPVSAALAYPIDPKNLKDTIAQLSGVNREA